MPGGTLVKDEDSVALRGKVFVSKSEGSYNTHIVDGAGMSAIRRGRCLRCSLTNDVTFIPQRHALSRLLFLYHSATSCTTS